MSGPAKKLFALVVGFLTALSVLLLSSKSLEAQPQPARKILALYWYGRDFPANEAFDRTLRSTFQTSNDAKVDYYAEYLESNRFPGSDQSLALRDYLSRKYAVHKLDAIIAMSEVSVYFLLEHRKQLFTNTPIVFYTGSRPELRQEAAGLGLSGVVAVGERYRDTLDAALKFHPATKQVFIIYGAGVAIYGAGVAYLRSEGSSGIDRYRNEFREFESRVSLNYLYNLSLGDLIAKVKNLPKQSIILYIRQSQDGPGEVLAPRECLALIAQAASVPIYGVSSDYLGSGVVGGYVSSIEAGAVKTAEIALRVAGGARTQDIPIAEMTAVPMFDSRLLRRWGIPDSRLPPGSIIHFREPTLWEQYRWQILAVVIVCLLQALLIGVLLAERGRRRRNAEALEKTNAKLRESMTEIKNLSGRLITAQEEERRRISRELHDDLSQQIAALGVRLSSLKRSLAGVDNARESVAGIQTDLLRLSDATHALSHELHPGLVEGAGLAPAVRAHCEEFERVNNIKVHLTEGLGRTIPADVGLCLYRITQEALRNVVKHSAAREVWVSLTELEGHIQLTIEDAGRGFDPQKVRGSGIGLVSMKERVDMVGGTFDVDSRPGGGTTTRVIVPVPLQSVAAV